MSKEKWHSCALITGIFAFGLLFFKTLVWSILFARLGFSDDLPQCVAADGIDQPINLLTELSRSDPAIAIQIAESSDIQEDVTETFLFLFKFLSLQNMLFVLLLTACCCYGQAHANVYDMFFLIYSLFLLSTVGTFIWACWVRAQYTSKVCSGDFIIDDGKID